MDKVQAKSVILFILSGLFILAIPGCLIWLDRPVLNMLAEDRPLWPEKNEWINAFRQLGKAWGVLWLLLLHAWVARHSRVLIPAVLSLLLVTAVVTPLKIIVSRPRPEHVLSMQRHPQKTINRWQHSSQSFPSGDTATVFAVAAAVTLAAAWPWSIPLMLAAGAIGALRVFTLDHNPSDVCAGAAIGILAGWFAWRFAVTRCLTEVVELYSRWRTVVMVLVIALPLVSLVETHNPLFAFLRVYWFVIVLFIVADQIKKRYRRT